MTVGELVDALWQFDRSLPVVMAAQEPAGGYREDGYFTIEDVTMIAIEHNARAIQLS